RMDVIWNPDDYSIEDLVVCLGEKDLTTVKLLSAKTKEIDDVAYASAMGGKVVALAALLLVAAAKVNESILVLHDADLGTKEKTNVYECVIREALSFGGSTTTTSLRAAKRTCTHTESEIAERRKLLLCEIELLQLFGAAGQSGYGDKKVISPLIFASQAGDEAVIELLLKKNNVNDTDAEGNSALHCCLKASKGSSEQQIKLLREDPDCIHSKTGMKETPLFFAVKNDHLNCAELLLRWGANSEVLNLRICSSTKTEICKYFESPSGCVRGATCFYAHGQEELRQVKQGMNLHHSPIANILKRKVFVGGLPPSIDSDSLGCFFNEQFGSVEDAIVLGIETKDEIKSRGFGFVTFKHEKPVSAAIQAHYVTIMGKRVEIKGVIRKSLTEVQKSSPIQHEHEQNNHYQPRAQMPTVKATGNTPSLKMSTEKIKELPCLKTYDDKTTEQMPSSQSPSEETTEAIASSKTTKETHNSKTNGEVKPEKMSWVDTLLHGQPKSCCTDSEAHDSTIFEDQNMPVWLKTFINWLPCFLKEVSKRPKEGEYALSSLKADFRAVCGLELDHASLGYLKLSDFMRCFPNLCHMEIVPVGNRGPANHMVLLPGLPKPHKQLHKPSIIGCMPCCATPTHDSGNGGSKYSKQSEDLLSVSDVSFISSSTEEGNLSNMSNDLLEEDLEQEVKSPTAYSGFLQFFKPYSLFGSRSWLCNEGEGGSGETDDERGSLVDEFEGMEIWNQPRHLVLEAISRKRNNSSVFFLHEFDFYDNYRESISEGKCFGCNEHRLLWANFPCRHLLWCSDCKLKAIQAAGNFEHKCVVCGVKVHKFVLSPSNAYNWSSCGHFLHDEELPPFDSTHTPMPPQLKSPLVG
ncbi:LOW QUALITY PROTEIN: RRM_1 domain-containing protein/Ank_2 domain-containing protein/OST-HTH domain-containing protein, partial [Cephalotus follicularis]